MSEHVDIESYIRTIPDFPIPGIQFKDITPLLASPQAFSAVINRFTDRYTARGIDAVVGIESRGFIFGAPLALQLGAAFVPIRKPGKLPHQTLGVDYSLEYGTNRLEIHRDAVQPGAQVLVIDDLLATGGTIAAACDLLTQLGAQVIETAFLIELGFLQGRSRLGDRSVFSLVRY
ncbi:MAG TPA: adenine phosphoribosyltransferase [Herpetosiphonaceae bacterium]|nr:adenine phosphoribosyltransferase [Herpetosiphonaceae bacterium]